MFSERHGKRRWGDKRPMYASRIAAVFDLFPGAHFINVVRDPRACIASLRKLNWYDGSIVPSVELWERSLRSVDAMRGFAGARSTPRHPVRGARARPGGDARAGHGFIGPPQRGCDDPDAPLLRGQGDAQRALPLESRAAARHLASVELDGVASPEEIAFVEAETAPLMERWGYKRVAEGVAAPAEPGKRLAAKRKTEAAARRRVAGATPAEARHPPISARRPPQRLHRCCHGAGAPVEGFRRRPRKTAPTRTTTARRRRQARGFSLRRLSRQPVVEASRAFCRAPRLDSRRRHARILCDWGRGGRLLCCRKPGEHDRGRAAPPGVLLSGLRGRPARPLHGQLSGFGAWLDTGCDRAKEYLVYAGLALGSTHGFGEDVWLLAACALALQTIRHMADFAWVVVRPAGGDAPLTPSRWLRSANQLIRLPIAERFALISLTAAVASPRVTFVTLLAWGGLGAVFALSVRVGLSLSVRPAGAR